MSKLEIILSISLFISMALNIGVFTYARNVVVKLLSVSEEMGDMKTMIDTFYNHLVSIYQMEMFYGDETLGFLVEHTRSLAEQLDTFEYIYTLTEVNTDNINEIKEEDNDAEQ
jgi:CRISPR/Cas system Type II protein with McrA/HNH and RuvC-like nuclease domain